MMDIFSASTLREAKHRFSPPRMRTVHHVEVLYADGSVDYVDHTGELSTHRDDALLFSELEEAAAYYTLLCLRGLDASIETSQMTVN